MLTISPTLLDVSVPTPSSDSLLPPFSRAKDEAGGADARAAVTAAVAAAKVKVAGARKDLAERVEALKIAAKESKKTCRRLEQVICVLVVLGGAGRYRERYIGFTFIQGRAVKQCKSTSSCEKCTSGHISDILG